jgi:hypothetical protein
MKFVAAGGHAEKLADRCAGNIRRDSEEEDSEDSVQDI